MTWLLVVIVGLTVVLAVWQTVQITAVRAKVDAVPRDGNVVAVLRNLTERVDALESFAEQAGGRLADLERRLPFTVSRTGVVTYDAFGNISGHLSRSIALLSERGDGLVLSVLATREETLFFAKEVREGRGVEQLSPEEAAAVERALGR